MENESFPSLFLEGWIRPQFRRMALFTGGDGVVIAKFGLLISTTSPKSMKLTNYPDNKFSGHY
jgi:hypothetical protein